MCKAFVEHSLWVLPLNPLVLLVLVSIVVELDLLIDELLIILRIQVIKFKIKIKSLDLFRYGLIILEMQVFQIRMVKGILDCDPLRRVELEHFLHQIDGFLVLVLEVLPEVHSFVRRDLAQDLRALGVRGHALDLLFCRVAYQVHNHLNLFFLVVAREKRRSQHHFSQDAAD